MKVLVTGGSGLLGRALHSLQREEQWEGEWVYASSADADLTDAEQAESLFRAVRPTHVIHLAARVGGLFANQGDNAGFFAANMRLNLNVLEACKRHAVQKVVACLSTCVFADGAPLPLQPDALHQGPPHPSNAGYAWAKRMLEVMCRLYSQELGRPYVCVAPTNLYGPWDNFSLEDGHVAPALMHRALLASREPGQPLRVKGSGAPLRQFLFSKDAARLLWHALRGYTNTQAPLILSPPPEQEVSIARLAALVAQQFGVRVQFEGDAAADGQDRKTASAEGVWQLAPGFRFTPIEQGIEETVAWFKGAFPGVRL